MVSLPLALPSSATIFSRLSSFSRASRAPVSEGTNFRIASQTRYLFCIHAIQSSRPDHLLRTATLNLPPPPDLSFSSSPFLFSYLSPLLLLPLLSYCKLRLGETIHVFCSCSFLCSDRSFPSHGSPCSSLFTSATSISFGPFFLLLVRHRNKLAPFHHSKTVEMVVMVMMVTMMVVMAIRLIGNDGGGGDWSSWRMKDPKSRRQRARVVAGDEIDTAIRIGAGVEEVRENGEGKCHVRPFSGNE